MSLGYKLKTTQAGQLHSSFIVLIVMQTVIGTLAFKVKWVLGCSAGMETGSSTSGGVIGEV